MRPALSILVGLSLLLPGAAQTGFRYTGLPCVTLQNSGPSSRKIDIVFIGDGYNKEDLGPGKACEKDARAAMDELFRVSPYADYRNRFNVHLVMVESHLDRRATRAAGPESYAFGSHLETSGQDMVVLDRTDKFLEAAGNAPEVDVLVALTTVAGRANAHDLRLGGRQIPSAVLTHGDYAVLAHELGHGIGGLGDEYESTSKLADRTQMPAHPSQDFGEPNLTFAAFINPANRDTIRKTARWGHFLDLPDSYPLVSAYQGGWYQSVGVWRPSYRCVMRSSTGSPFCPICHEELVKQILTRCGERFDDAAYHRQFPLKRWK